MLWLGSGNLILLVASGRINFFWLGSAKTNLSVRVNTYRSVLVGFCKKVLSSYQQRSVHCPPWLQKNSKYGNAVKQIQCFWVWIFTNSISFGRVRKSNCFAYVLEPSISSGLVLQISIHFGLIVPNQCLLALALDKTICFGLIL